MRFAPRHAAILALAAAVLAGAAGCRSARSWRADADRAAAERLAAARAPEGLPEEAVESSRPWKENLIPLEVATDADLALLENLDTTNSPVRFWRIAVTPFELDEGEKVGFKPAASAPADPDGD